MKNKIKINWINFYIRTQSFLLFDLLSSISLVCLLFWSSLLLLLLFAFSFSSFNSFLAWSRPHNYFAFILDSYERIPFSFIPRSFALSLCFPLPHHIHHICSRSVDIVQFSVYTDEIIACHTSRLCLLSWTHRVRLFFVLLLLVVVRVVVWHYTWTALPGLILHSWMTCEWGKRKKRRTKKRNVYDKSWQEKISIRKTMMMMMTMMILIWWNCKRKHFSATHRNANGEWEKKKRQQ